MTKQHAEQTREIRDQKHLIDAAWRQMEGICTSTSGARGRGAGLDLLRARSDTVPDALPGYRMVREIHRGGQGVVYEAVQESTQRTVAIKVMREGPFAGANERSRFEREVQILARLRHPNIVTIHDSGLHGTSAYFVMDYIPGAQLDRYVAKHQPTLSERLALFAKICDAVNAAHLRGVIHRDLKPGNVRIDADGEPHVLDFGLAKQSLIDDDRDATLTVTGQFVGSLPWASPEQAEGRVNEIDLRTDVYALGVVLYQLLTGTFPYKISSSLRETTESIVNAEPLNPRLHNRELSDDASTIVLKCLRKERELRYQSAGELARDIRRYLSGDAIEAKRDSMVYVMRKQLSRHRVTAGVLGIFVAVVLAGLATSLTYWRRAADQRDRAREAEQLADQRLADVTLARDAEGRARDQAEQSAETARQVSDFLRSILTSIDPALALGRDTTILEEVLAAAVGRVERELEDEPEVQAAVREAIGSAYSSLGQYDQAVPHLRSAVELRRANSTHEPIGIITALNSLAITLKAQGVYNEGEALYREALAIARALPPEDNLLRAELLNNLGQLLHRVGRPDEAQSLYDEGLPLTEDGGVEARLMRAFLSNNLALVLQDARDFESAERLFQESISIRTEFYGGPHPELATCLDNLGMLYLTTGRMEQAEEPLLQALKHRRDTLPPGHPKLAFSYNNLANYYHDRRRYDEAEEYYRGALEVLRQQFGEEHPHIAATINNLAFLFRDQGKLATAEPLFRQALDMRRRLLGEQHPAVAQGLNNLAGLLIARGELEAAEPMSLEAMRRYREIWGEANPRTATAMTTRAKLLRMSDRHDEAESLYREAADIRRQSLGPQHPRTLGTLIELAHVLCDKGDLVGGEALYGQVQQIIDESLPPEHLLRASVQAGLGRALIAQRRFAEAETAFREALAVRELAASGSTWKRFETMCSIGHCLLELGRLEEAEALLLAGYAGLAEEPNVPIDTLRDAAAHLVRLYMSTNDAVAAAQWQEQAEAVSSESSGRK